MHRASLIPQITALGALLEASSEGILFVLPDYRLGLMNDSFRTILFSFWGIVAHIGQDVMELIDLYEVRQLIGPAIEGALNGQNGTYSQEIDKHNTTFYFEVSSFGMPDGLGGMIILKDKTEIRRQTTELKTLEVALDHGYKLMDLLTQQVKLQNRHILRGPSIWGQQFSQVAPANTTHPFFVAQESLIILGLSLNNALNKFTSASDILNKKLVMTESRNRINQDLWQQLHPLQLMANERLTPVEIKIDPLITQDQDLELAYDQAVLQTILLSVTEMAFLRANGGLITINIKVNEQGEDDIVLHFEIEDTNDTIPDYQDYILADDYLDRIKELPKSYQVPYVGLRYALDLIAAWGGSLKVKPVASGGHRWTIALSFRRVKVQTQDLVKGKLLVIAVSDQKLNYLSYVLGGAGYEVTRCKTIEEANQALVSDLSHPFEALLIQTDIGLFRQQDQPDNANYHFSSLQKTIQGWLMACELHKIKPPVLVALQLLPTIYWQGQLNSIGIQLNLPIPLEVSSLEQLNNALLGSVQVSELAILPDNVDTSYLTNLAGNDPGFWREMISLYIQNVPMAIDELQDLINRADYQLAAAAIHKLKSNLKLMGLHEASILANDLEQQYLLRTISPDHQQQFGRFRQHLQGSVQYYNRELSRLNLPSLAS